MPLTASAREVDDTFEPPQATRLAVPASTRSRASHFSRRRQREPRSPKKTKPRREPCGAGFRWAKAELFGARRRAVPQVAAPASMVSFTRTEAASATEASAMVKQPCVRLGALVMFQLTVPV